ncbi:DUF1507 family protein [Atopobacter phocae]|uniref:DUF1507 family protein n=1 Tax=Atopobacter phocae TaxID=136492 RepID=UPI0004B19E43|nr:DUF1507 family protein [Atopobacter phocae]
MNDKARTVLKENADAIYQLIMSQKNHLCLSECPAFEEVVDTQLFGLSKQLEFAVAIGELSQKESQQMINQLEGLLDEIYQETYK